jgi:hypothetical protein
MVYGSWSHEWIKCTSKCFKDNNKASHFIPQLWISFSDLCQALKKNSNSADLCHLYLLGGKLHQHMRWGLMLQGYNLSIKHIKCKDNCIANVFARLG